MPLALLFDIDGTLLDTLDAIIEAMNRACLDLNVSPPFHPDELRPMIGTPVETQLHVLRGVRGSLARAFANRYYAHFTRLVDDGVRPFPGVRESFPLLRGRPISTVSTRRRDEARHMLRVAGLLPYFTTIVGGDDVANPKPNPDLPLYAAESLRVQPRMCAVIGDSPVDIQAGRAAGMRMIAVTYGYGGLAALRDAAPDAMIDAFDRVPDTLRDLESTS